MRSHNYRIGFCASMILAQLAPMPAAHAAAEADVVPVQNDATTATPPEAAPERCMRLPLSDVAFGREAATAAARVKLADYALREAKRRGWSGSPSAESNSKVSCDIYLDFGPLIGTEYRCLVTTTFCERK